VLSLDSGVVLDDGLVAEGVVGQAGMTEPVDVLVMELVRVASY